MDEMRKSEPTAPPTETDSKDTVRVLLVSALPPPTGGVSTWTEQILREGFPAGYEIYLVDTSISNLRRAHGASAWAGEASRTARIIASFLWQLARVRPHVIHLNCSPVV